MKDKTGLRVSTTRVVSALLEVTNNVFLNIAEEQEQQFGKTSKTILSLTSQQNIQQHTTKTCKEPFSVYVHSAGPHGVQD